jgi:hypothetical protein
MSLKIPSSIRIKNRSIDTLDLLTIISVVSICFYLWLPHRYFPFHWDAAGFLNYAVENLINTDFNPLITTNSDFAHPPFFVAAVALVFKLFGRQLLYAHLLLFPLLPILSVSAYYLGKKTRQPLVAITAAFLTLTTPVILAEYINIYIDLPSATFALLAFALYVYRKPNVATFFLTLALLTKLSALLIFPAIIYYAHYLNQLKTRQFILLVSIPLLSLVGYFFYHYTETQWLFTQPGRSLATPSNLSDLYDSLWFVTKSILIDQGRFALTLPVILILLYIFMTKSTSKLKPPKIIFASLLSLGTSIVFFTVSGEFAPRYAIIIYPLFYVSVLSLMHQSINVLTLKYQFKLFSIYLSLGFIANVYHWYPPATFADQYQFRPPSDLSVIDFITLNRIAALTTQTKFHNALLYGGFPENLYLSEPIHGYVTKPLNINLCSNFTPNEDKIQLIFLHPYSPSQIACRQLLDRLTVKPLERFEYGSQWIELYHVEDK